MAARRPGLTIPPILLVLLILAACGPEALKPTPTPGPETSPTLVGGLPGTPELSEPETELPDQDEPVNRGTPTPSGTPTETPQPTFISTPGAGPTLVVKPGINVGKEQFDEALAKWRAQGVEEYEMVVERVTLSPWAGTWNLRVSDGGTKVEIISYTGSSGVPSTPAVEPDTVVFLTVEQQFAAVEHVLTAGEFGELERLVDYVVAFDPALGYPSSIEIKPKPNVKAPDLGSSTMVKSVKILKRGSPVVPSATQSP